MTEKRYVYNVHKNCIETTTGEFVAYLNSMDGVIIARKWNELAEENEQLKQELFETKKELLWATSDNVDRALHFEDEVKELRKEIFE